MKYLPLLFAGLLAVLTGCATTVPDVDTYVDNISGKRTDFIPENLLDTPGETRELLWLNASRVFKSMHEFNYYLEARYMAREESGYLDILPGVSLVIVADGRELKFSGLGSLNTRRDKDGLVSEDAIYEVPGEVLRTIAYAKQVSVSVRGKNGIVQRDFAPENFEKFKRFVAEFVEGSGRVQTNRRWVR